MTAICVGLQDMGLDLSLVSRNYLSGTVCVEIPDCQIVGLLTVVRLITKSNN